MGLKRALESYISESHISGHKLENIEKIPGYETLDKRSKIVDAILSRNSEMVLELLDLWYPGVVAFNNEAVMKILLLRLCNFIINKDSDGAVSYCQGPLASMVAKDPSTLEIFKPFTILMVSSNPTKTEFGYLLSQRWLTSLAGDINMMLLRYSHPDYKSRNFTQIVKLHKFSESFLVENTCDITED
ncbi:Glucose-induced degradation protein 8 [Thelohanellus kitauei]|uniref:Glucose-induced degradation protein 8 n=1 Tax=Thelohanellus kitauei TaxID=669202 RepID=A0A0C2J9I5_THEKT|nr:Glucose-induced degradation protein 8 [Thelohanellus kitauei]